MVNMSSSPTSYFERIDAATYAPTRWTRGAWKETEQHFAPIGGLVVHAVEQFVTQRGGEDGLEIGSIHFDILGVVKLVPMVVDVRSVRPGRTVELLEASVHAEGRVVALARIWRMAKFDTSAVAGGAAPALPAPQDIAPWAMHGVWPGDFIASLDVRAVRPPEPGRGTAWISTGIDLVAGEQASELARFIMLVDTANGVAVRESPSEWMYPNLDLSIHLFRQPYGPWVGLDASVVFGEAGLGLTSAVLHDIHGPVGRTEQTLTVRRMPGLVTGV